MLWLAACVRSDMSQFMTQEMLEPKPSLCTHYISVPEVFQDEGDRVHRACWTLASMCKKCGSVFVYGSGYGYWEDRLK